jgi:hypothetical protein
MATFLRDGVELYVPLQALALKGWWESRIGRCQLSNIVDQGTVQQEIERQVTWHAAHLQDANMDTATMMARTD